MPQITPEEFTKRYSTPPFYGNANGIFSSMDTSYLAPIGDDIRRSSQTPVSELEAIIQQLNSFDSQTDWAVRKTTPNERQIFGVRSDYVIDFSDNDLLDMIHLIWDIR